MVDGPVVGVQQDVWSRLPNKAGAVPRPPDLQRGFSGDRPAFRRFSGDRPALRGVQGESAPPQTDLQQDQLPAPKKGWV